jgi:hypothetical protein
MQSQTLSTFAYKPWQLKRELSFCSVVEGVSAAGTFTASAIELATTFELT